MCHGVTLTSNERLALLCSVDVEVGLKRVIESLRAQLVEREEALAVLQQDRMLAEHEIFVAHKLDPDIPLSEYVLEGHFLKLRKERT